MGGSHARYVSNDRNLMRWKMDSRNSQTVGYTNDIYKKLNAKNKEQRGACYIFTMYVFLAGRCNNSLIKHTFNIKTILSACK